VFEDPIAVQEHRRPIVHLQEAMQHAVGCRIGNIEPLAEHDRWIRHRCVAAARGIEASRRPVDAIPMTGQPLLP
jgi:hypothetical protein